MTLVMLILLLVCGSLLLFNMSIASYSLDVYSTPLGWRRTESRSLVLAWFHLCISFIIACSPHCLVYMVVDLVGKYPPRSAIDLRNDWNQALSLFCRRRRLRIPPPKPRSGSRKEIGAVLAREILLLLEGVCAIGLMLWSPCSYWSMTICAYLLITKAGFLMRSAIGRTGSQVVTERDLYSATRNIAFTLVNYIVVVLLFAEEYLYLGKWGNFDVTGMCPNESWVAAVYFSAVTITTLGYGDMRPATDPARLVTIGELLFGILLLVIVLQLFLGVRTADEPRPKKAVR